MGRSSSTERTTCSSVATGTISVRRQVLYDFWSSNCTLPPPTTSRLDLHHRISMGALYCARTLQLDVGIQAASADPTLTYPAGVALGSTAVGPWTDHGTTGSPAREGGYISGSATVVNGIPRVTMPYFPGNPRDSHCCAGPVWCLHTAWLCYAPQRVAATCS